MDQIHLQKRLGIKRECLYTHTITKQFQVQETSVASFTATFPAEILPTSPAPVQSRRQKAQQIV